MARCRAFSECSGSCCVPDRDPGWPMLPVSVDSPRSDSPQPCGQPKQQFPCPLDADREFDTDTQRSFRQSIFGATSTKFPAPRIVELPFFVGHGDQLPVAVSGGNFRYEDRGLLIVVSRGGRREGDNADQCSNCNQQESDPFHNGSSFRSNVVYETVPNWS